MTRNAGYGAWIVIWHVSSFWRGVLSGNVLELTSVASDRMESLLGALGLRSNASKGGDTLQS